MTDAWTDRLSDYLDGELPPEEAARLESHLEGCAGCRRTLADLRAVVERAGRLESRPPERDLWPEIAARIGLDVSEAGASRPGESRPEPDIAPGRERSRRGGRSPGRRFSFTFPQLAAAALILIGLAGTTTWLMTGTPGVPGADPGARTVAVGDASLALADDFRPGGYDEAIAQLETILFYGEDVLDTATVRSLRESLATVDRAIEEASGAVEQDPANPYLRQYLAETMRKKATFLQQTVSLVASDM